MALTEAATVAVAEAAMAAVKKKEKKSRRQEICEQRVIAGLAKVELFIVYRQSCGRAVVS